ncbi:OmpA family protein [Jiella sp. CQZ9-1]|uniref:OmpA family protein n=2 Tax=Jiella flava TaxID=2816857 RepID=A0A939FY87_9HYPH|nr:OmpA family protein [Jiella flava]
MKAAKEGQRKKQNDAAEKKQERQEPAQQPKSQAQHAAPAEEPQPRAKPAETPRQERKRQREQASPNRQEEQARPARQKEPAPQAAAPAQREAPAEKKAEPSIFSPDALDQVKAKRREGKKAEAPAPEARPANEPVPAEKPGKSEPSAPVPQEAPAKAGTTAPAAATATEPQTQAAPKPAEQPAAKQSDAERLKSLGIGKNGIFAPNKPSTNQTATEPATQPQTPQGTSGTATAPTKEAPATTAEQPPAPKPVPAKLQNEPVKPNAVSASDARVQKLAQPVQITPITEEEGQRIEPPATDRRDRNGRRDRRRDAARFDPARGELPPGVKVVKRDDDGRQILSIVGAGIAGAAAGAAAAYFIKSDNDSRIAVDSRESYYDRLPQGRVRQTVIRDNGVKVVTVTNRYGEIIRRSRIEPDGREVVLFYDPYARDDRQPTYEVDPGRDLPPLRVDIPEDEYIVDTSRPDEELYYRTLIAPPVETVNRIYSVDEVLRSQRLRAKTRRIDLSTINFDFGSAQITESQVGKLQALAEAINKIVDKNPSETFLVEGHTDAVGSQLANLDLSDKRAEAVAAALTKYFDVPPENLVTQGYGEEGLKVNTQAPNRENRRVTLRRITPLVRPIETSRN